MVAWALSGRLVIWFTVVVMFACESEATHEGTHAFIVGDDLVSVVRGAASLDTSDSGLVVGGW